ncbi:MAG TPA: restriction endonuclease [Rhizomicrobium sp.]
MRVRVAVPVAEPSASDSSEGTKSFKSIWGDILKPRDPKIEKIVAKHLFVLARKRTQLLTKDDYGKYRKKGWEKELSNFLSDVLIPEMPWWHPLRQKAPSNRHLMKAAKIVDGLVAEQCERLKAELVSEDVPIDGVAYELFCQRALEANGWKVQGTKKSGDQGVDLMGQYGNCVVAFQCKRYSQPVGNKAVQEVTAGRKFYQAHMAAIVTNASYTEAAQSLAIANDVLLLHHSDLPRLGERVATKNFDRK